MDANDRPGAERRQGEGPAGPGYDGLDLLLDEALRELVQAPTTDLKARVMTALEEAETPIRPVGSPRFGLASFGTSWRPALALAATLILVVAALVLVRQFAEPGPQQARSADRSSPRLRGGANGAGRAAAPASEPGQPMATASEPPASGTRAPVRKRPAASPDSRQGWEVEPVELSALANEPYLPGAPAGELGDPLAPLPAPPPINFTPITQASVTFGAGVSDIARPVTDFPADSQQPAPNRDAGTSGGTRR